MHIRWPFSFRRPPTKWLLLAVVLGFVAAVPALAAGEPTGDLVLSNVYHFLSIVVMGIVQFVGGFTALMIHLLVIVSSYNEFINVPVVKTGWAIVRDVTNMFFLIALLIIAAGTVLRLENYLYNRLLGRVILMAFLVQFSRIITGFLIQTAQVVTLTFVNSYREVMFGNFAHMFGLDQVLQFASDNAQLNNPAQGFNVIFISLLAGLTLMVVSFIVSAALVIIFFIRTITLWVLIILSPLAYALDILPNTKAFPRKWWDDFGKWVTVGPVLAFMLWLSLALISSTAPGSQFGKSLGETSTKYATEKAVSTPFATDLFALPKITAFLVGIIFLIIGLQYATALGGAAGNVASKFSGAAVGAALTTSGIARVRDTVRDRAVAPVQGWLKNRQAAGQARVKERTETLEAGGDRLRAAVPAPFGIGAGGRERARAASEASERMRTTRYIQERGLAQMTPAQMDQELNGTMSPVRALLPETRRRRAALLQTMQQRGTFNLDNPLHDAAFAQYADDNRLSPEERRQFQLQALRGYVNGRAPAALEARLRQTQDGEARMLIEQELDRQGARQSDNAAAVASVNATRASLAGLPQRLQEFDDALKKSNPRMALQTIYNGFQRGQQDIDRMLEDVQAGKFDLKHLTSRDVAFMTQQMRQQNNVPTRQAQGHIANSIIRGAKTPEELERIMGGMNDDARRHIFDQVQLDPATQRERRDSLARQGFIGEAYEGLGNAEQIRTSFVAQNEARVAELARAGRISGSSFRTDGLMRGMMDSRRIGRTGIDEMLKNNPGLRDAAAEAALRAVQADNRNAATASANGADAAGRAQNNRREIAMLLRRGGNVRNAAGQDQSILDAVVDGLPAAQADHGREFRRRTISRNGGQLRDVSLDTRHTSPQAIRDVVTAMPPRQLNLLADENPDTARQIAREKETLANPNTQQYQFELVDPTERTRATNEVRNIQDGERGLL